MTIEIEYFDDIGKLQADPRATAALAQARSPFERPEWWRLLAEECGLAPLIALAASGDEALVWPLARAGDKLTSLANFYNFEAGWLASPGADIDALARALVLDFPRRVARLDLGPLPLSPDNDILWKVLSANNWYCETYGERANHYLAVGNRDYETYLADRPGRLRSTLKRKAKRVEAIVSTQLAPEDWESYRAIYAASWKPAEASFEFWRRFANEEAAAGRLRFALARHEGKPVAAQIWTVEHGTAFIHKLAHLPEAEPNSPGTVLTAALMRHVIAQDGVARVDFGTGDEGYKRDWMEANRTLVSLRALRPGPARNWAALARLLARRAYRRLVPTEPRGYAPQAATERATMATRQTIEPSASAPVRTDTIPAIDAKLRSVLADILGLDETRVAQFEPGTGLFGHLPELDSQAVATLLTEIEDRFDIVIDDEDVDGEMLETYDGLHEFVRAKCGAAA